MSEKPGFIKAYSKAENSEGRDAAAALIRESRAERAGAKSSEQNVEQGAEALAGLEGVKEQIEMLGNKEVEKIQELLTLIGVKKRLAPEATELVLPPSLAEPKELLDAFYEGEKERWSNSEGGPELMRELFSEQHLTALSMSEYGLLLKHFPSAMVTHVTRQGVRDHVGMHDHNKGNGKFANGFKNILESGTLKSALAIAATEKGKEEVIAKELGLDRYQTSEEASQQLEWYMNGQEFVDRAAVHVAAEEVADQYYGSETGNEIFIAFPSAHIASEHRFIGNLSEKRHAMHNDTYILNDENPDRGMDINAGVVFIPAEAKVNKETGSRYALDEAGNPVENIEARAGVEDIFKRQGIFIWADELESQAVTPDLVSKFEERFGDMPEVIIRALVTEQESIRNLNEWYKTPRNREDVLSKEKQLIDGIVEKAGVRFQEATDTVSSKEYWEAHFDANPGQRPSKIEYYKGTNPTDALYTWKEKHGLTRAGTESDYDLGNGGARVRNLDDYESAEKSRFRSIAENIIDERFKKAA